MHRPGSVAPATFALLTLGASLAQADEPAFELLGRYTTGLAVVDEEITSAETAALRHGKLYVTNAFDVSLDIVDVRNPQAPSLLRRVDLSAYGAKVNSVDATW
ncbi:MAG TPA: hypothetical protein VIC71_02175, partial [Gammaproteobacteria bacterium]